MRLTKYDKVRRCYVMKPDAKQGEHIQRLGKYEDKDTPYRIEYKTVDDEYEYECGRCNTVVSYSDTFCPDCGQRLKNGGF